MNGTQVIEKEKKSEKVNLDCSTVDVLSFQTIVDSFVEKCSNKGAQNDLKKSIVRYALGFSKENLLNNVLRLRSFPRTEVTALKEQLSTACIVSTLETVLDMVHFQTSKADAIAASMVDPNDLDWALSIVDLKTLDVKSCTYTLPDDIDGHILRLRLPDSKKIETPSKLGQLIEDFLIAHDYPSMNAELRKTFSQYLMGQISEAIVTKKTYNHETPYRKVIGYINKNYKAIQEALKTGKGEKSFKEDSDYVTAVMKA